MIQNEPVDPVVLGQRLAEARRVSGRTQKEAADYLGCSRPTVIAIEKGTRPATAGEIVRLASLYGRTVHELVRPGAPAVALEPHLRAAVDASRGDVEEINEAVRMLGTFAEDYRELERIGKAPLRLSYPPEVHIPRRGKLAEFAEDVAGRERARMMLGDQPLLDLRGTLESEVGIRVFYAPMPSGIAGMYAYVADLGYCVLINRKHPPERQRASLAHEYGHFLSDRHRPGIDYLLEAGRRPLRERFAEKFAMSFLMPRSGLCRRFNEVVEAKGDFQVADLCRLSSFFFVSVQAMTLRLEELRLIDRGAWDYLTESGFKANRAREALDLPTRRSRPEEPYPERYKFLAVLAYQEEAISEGQLAHFLRCDRVTARGIVAECVRRAETDAEGNSALMTFPFKRSLLAQLPD
jgi:Zn-dependent peptidase ImmA (M78 family)/transcriptional regulator with XRE-family HTH domain